MSKYDVSDLRMSFRSVRGQEEVAPAEEKIRPSSRERKLTTNATTKPDAYVKFLEKYHHADIRWSEFTAMDIVYFFRETAKEAGVNYVIANKARDVAVLKKALQSYSNYWLCLMIEFIFESEQEYLTKETVAPTILVSAMCNRIYADTVLWVRDEYFPTNSTGRIYGEWVGEAENKGTRVGEW